MNILRKVLLVFIMLLTLSCSSKQSEATSFANTPFNTMLITSSDGLIWAKGYSHDKTCYWNGSAWVQTSAQFDERPPYDSVDDIFIDSKNRLWISGEYDCDDYKYTTGYFTMNNDATHISNWGYEVFVKDTKTGNIWTYGYPDGDFYYTTPTVGYFNGNGFTHLSSKAPWKLAGDCLTIDYNETPWIGGTSKKVAYWNGSSWVTDTIPFSNYLSIRTMVTANDGSIIAIGYDNYASGWAVYKDGIWTVKQEVDNRYGAAPIKPEGAEGYGPDGVIWGISYEDDTKLTYYEDGILSLPGINAI